MELSSQQESKAFTKLYSVTLITECFSVKKHVFMSNYDSQDIILPNICEQNAFIVLSYIMVEDL